MTSRHTTSLCSELPGEALFNVSLRKQGSSVSIHFECEDDEKVFPAELSFTKVRAYQHVAESHCPAWKIEAAYATLVLVKDSEWVAELCEATSADRRENWVMNHYLIYFDEDGCFEVIAEDWSLQSNG